MSGAGEGRSFPCSVHLGDGEELYRPRRPRPANRVPLDPPVAEFMDAYANPDPPEDRPNFQVAPNRSLPEDGSQPPVMYGFNLPPHTSGWAPPDPFHQGSLEELSPSGKEAKAKSATKAPPSESAAGKKSPPPFLLCSGAKRSRSSRSEGDEKDGQPPSGPRRLL